MHKVSLAFGSKVLLQHTIVTCDGHRCLEIEVLSEVCKVCALCRPP